MKVFSCCYDDYANFAFANTEALKSVGVDASGGKLIPHPFGYDNELPVINLEQMTEEIRRADIVQIMHSDMMALKLCKTLKKKCVVYHTGSIYRTRPEYMKEMFNPVVLVSFSDQTEFIGTGMKNEQYIATAVDTDKIKFVDKEIKLPYIMAHYPSNPEVKGTQKIVEMMSKIQSDRFKFIYSTDKVSHAENLKRIAECDIYIEMFQPTLNGKAYGCWGVTAFEAAAMGKVVVTNNINKDAYIKAYGVPAMWTANDENEFNVCLEISHSNSFQSFSYKRNIVREWIEENHSLKATGQRIKNILEKYAA